MVFSYEFLCCIFIGKLNEKIAPAPSGLFSAQIFPSCASMMLLQMYSPNPVPLSDFVTNLENNIGIIWWSIPGPLSFTLTMTSASWIFDDI